MPESKELLFWPLPAPGEEERRSEIEVMQRYTGLYPNDIVLVPVLDDLGTHHPACCLFIAGDECTCHLVFE